MKTIKLFLASSDELQDDRIAIGNLVRRLDKIYEKRGIRVELFEWEDCDAAYNGERKQDEYNKAIKASDMFLALFHTKAGKYTLEEFDVATEEFRRHASPKVYVYCKDLRPGEVESPELREFKDRLFKELEHYWCRYGNRDTLQLHLVMQLQLVENTKAADLKVEDGRVTLDGMPVAKMDNLSFAAGNDEYRKMREELLALPERIEKARSLVEKHPEEEYLKEGLQEKINRYNELKDEFKGYQECLFGTARQIAEIQQGQVSDLLRRAIDAFEQGDLKKANVLLEEIAHEANLHIEQLEQGRVLVHQDIDALRLQAWTVITDMGIPLEDRILRVKAIYEKLDHWAQISAYPMEKYVDALSEYGEFLRRYAFYEDALAVIGRMTDMNRSLLGDDCAEVANGYTDSGLVNIEKGDYSRAIECLTNALTIQKRVLGEMHPGTGRSYHYLGNVYTNMGDYHRAFECYTKGMKIVETISGEESRLAASYSAMGSMLEKQGDYSQALQYSLRALMLEEKLFGKDTPEVAAALNNIGLIFNSQGDYPRSLESFNLALTINEKSFGEEHPHVATNLENIGHVYYDQGDYARALDFFNKAKSIKEKVLGVDSLKTATCYNCIGSVYHNMGDYDQALVYFTKALDISERMLGEMNPDTALSLDNIGHAYYAQGDYHHALEYHSRALKIWKSVLGEDDFKTAACFYNVGTVYYLLGDYPQAADYCSKALEILKKTVGESNPETAETYCILGNVSTVQGNHTHALTYYLKALDIYESIYGKDDHRTALCYNNVAKSHYLLKHYREAFDYGMKAKALLDGTETMDERKMRELDVVVVNSAGYLSESSRRSGFVSWLKGRKQRKS